MRTFNDIETRTYIRKWSWQMQRGPYRHGFEVRPDDWDTGVSVSDEVEVIALSLGHSVQHADGGHWVEAHASLTFGEVSHRAGLRGSVAGVLNDLYVSLFGELEIEPPMPS